MILLEGGNVWPDVEPFTKDAFQPILDQAQAAMPNGIELIPVGSSGHKELSGDMDLVVDEAQMLKYFDAKDAKTARAALEQHFINQGFESKRTGINVHIRIPNGDTFAQVDIMVVKDAGDVSKFHQHDYSIPNTPYKGLHKHILLSSIAKETVTDAFPNGMMWSGFQGLFARDANGKKGELITNNIDDVAKILLGADKAARDLGNVETILAALPGGAEDPKAQHAVTNADWPQPVQENFMNRLKSLAGLTEEPAPQAPATPAPAAQAAATPAPQATTQPQVSAKHFDGKSEFDKPDPWVEKISKEFPIKGSGYHLDGGVTAEAWYNDLLLIKNWVTVAAAAGEIQKDAQVGQDGEMYDSKGTQIQGQPGQMTATQRDAELKKLQQPQAAAPAPTAQPQAAAPAPTQESLADKQLQRIKELLPK
jgi:hypothetical protein